jgi:Tfp pilus assembly protein PilO
MDLEDLGIRYREIRLRNRLILLCILALVPAAFDFWDRWETLDTSRNDSYIEKANQQDKLKIALEKHQKLAKLEESLVSYELQVKEATKKLPDEIFIDRILQKTELIAQELGVALKLFHPQAEIPSETAFKYLKLPIRLDLVGTYGQIASFFDHIVHLEILINIENMKIEVEENKEKGAAVQKEISGEMERSKMRLRASCDMMVFRSLTAREAEALQAIHDAARKNAAELEKATVPGGAPGAAPAPEPAKNETGAGEAKSA